ncbi:MAG: two-component system regulatory protein YycI [Bacilli bacterium]
MDWNRIRIILIVAFAALNLFLIYNLFEKIQDSKLDYYEESTLDEQLKESKITYPVLPTEPVKSEYYAARMHVYSQSDMNGLKNQRSKIEGVTSLNGTLDKPKKMVWNGNDAYYDGLLKGLVPYDEEFTFGGYDEDKREIYFFQVIHNKRTFWHADAMVTLFVNEQNEITSYTQRKLDDVSKMEIGQGPSVGLSAMGALEVLFIKNFLEQNDTVTHYEDGFFELLNVSAESQIIVPMWHFVINNQQHYYVDTIDGNVYTLEQLMRSDSNDNQF